MTKKLNFDKDLYDLFGVTIDASENEIRRAYRKKALSCHPDKNPDNPKAAELFHELSHALEILCSESTRAAYDRVIKARKASEIRHKQFDSKRQRLNEDVELREKQAKEKHEQIHQHFYNEIDRLQREASKLLKEEQEFSRKQLQLIKEINKKTVFDSSQHRIKIKWKSEKHDSNNGGYNEEILHQFLRKYGDIVALVISSKKKGSALVEFKTQEAGENAVCYEKGMMNNPLTLEWIGLPPNKKGAPDTTFTFPSFNFEDIILSTMRQGEEIRRLIDEIM